MHLTPGFLKGVRPSRCTLGVITILVAAVACSPRPQVRVPTPTPTPQIVDSVITTTPHPPALSADSADYVVRARTITTEATVSPSVPDTLVLEETIRVTLVPGLAGSIELTFVSDSGYARPPDRHPPPETIRQSRSRILLHVSLVPGNELAIQQPEEHLGCPASTTLLSPLLVATTAWSVAQILQQGQPDTLLTYRTCSAGIARRYQVSMTNARYSSDSTEMLLAGTIQADSSRALPMMLRGVLHGKATALPSNGSAVLPALLEIHSVVEIRATAGLTHQQQFRQEIRMTLERRR